jgi:hypothetical protein
MSRVDPHRHASAVRGHPQHVPQPEVDADGPLQMQICSLDYSTYIGADRHRPHQARPHQAEPGSHRHVRRREPRQGQGQPGADLQGPRAHQAESAEAGDIVLVSGIEDQVNIGVTICAIRNARGAEADRGRRADPDHELHGQLPRRWPVAKASSSPAARSASASRRNC